MTVKLPRGWYDISVPLKQGMVYFPDDPAAPKIYRIRDRALGSMATLCMIEMIGHTGTHLDAPLHFIPDGSTISDMDVEATVGRCRVIEIKDPESIKVKELKASNIKKGERLIFKTSNSPRTYESPGSRKNTSIWIPWPRIIWWKSRFYCSGWIILPSGASRTRTASCKRTRNCSAPVSTFWKTAPWPEYPPESTNCFVYRC